MIKIIVIEPRESRVEVSRGSYKKKTQNLTIFLINTGGIAKCANFCGTFCICYYFIKKQIFVGT